MGERCDRFAFWNFIDEDGVVDDGERCQVAKVGEGVGLVELSADEVAGRDGVEAGGRVGGGETGDIVGRRPPRQASRVDAVISRISLSKVRKINGAPVEGTGERRQVLSPVQVGVGQDFVAVFRADEFVEVGEEVRGDGEGGGGVRDKEEGEEYCVSRIAASRCVLRVASRKKRMVRAQNNASAEYMRVSCE